MGSASAEPWLTNGLVRSTVEPGTTIWAMSDEAAWRSTAPDRDRRRRLPRPGFAAPWSPAIRPAVWEDALVLTFIIQGRHAQEAMRAWSPAPRTTPRRPAGRLT